jgi:NADH dehydrogenase
VLSHWILDWVTPRSLVNLSSHTPPAARHVHYRAGDRIYETGNRADGLYTVVDGAVEVRRHTDDAPKTRRVGPGEHFGERMVFGATRRLATARALEDTTVLVLNRAEFLKLYEGLPPFRDYFEAHLKREGLDWPLDSREHPEAAE